MQAHCLGGQHRQVQCNVYPSPPLYQRDLLDTVLVDSVFDGVDYVTDALYSLRSTSGRTLEGVCPDGRPCDGADALDFLIRELRSRAESQSLAPCQKICLAKCMTTRSFDYFAGWGGRQSIMNEEFALELGYGDCKSYSKLFDRLLGEVGVSSLTVSKLGVVDDKGRIGGHAFNAVELNGKWYYLDPTLDGCEFIDLGIRSDAASRRE